MQLPGLFFFRIDGSVLQTFLFESILVCQYIRDIREGRLGIVIKTGLVGIFFLVKYSTPYSSIYAVFALAITKGLSLSQFRLSPTSISQLQGCQGSISFLFAPHPLGFSSKWFWETETGGRGRGLNINGEWEGGIGIRPTPALCEAKWSRIFQPRVESGPDTANASLGSKGRGRKNEKLARYFRPLLYFLRPASLLSYCREPRASISHLPSVSFRPWVRLNR